jgi:two-component system CheB/CheR fusion protein
MLGRMSEQGGEPVDQLIVVGASAGGIEALTTLLSSLPTEFPAPIVVAQHLDPSRPSRLTEIMGRRSVLPVREITQQVPLQNGVVYLVPANRHVAITDHAVMVESEDHRGPKPSIDRLLETAARAFGDRLIAVILSGSGSDGAAGARHVKEAGGTVVIQNPETASYPGMPQSLAPTTVDLVAEVEHMGALLFELTMGQDTPTKPDEERTLRVFLDQLRERSGIDFNSYKMPTIMRRLQRRMVATGNNRLDDYLRYLQSHPDEYQRLVSSFLIKVTEFFRDPELFTYLREHVLPELIAEARRRGNELRLWSAGCATGEEAYSLAILVSDVLGDELDQFNVRIFATDLDLDAVAFARRGIYPPSALEDVPSEMVDRFFNRSKGDYEIKKQVRALTVFGQHDLGQRAPFPRIDLALCRNVLIYFTNELQKRALQLFAFSLRTGGYLVLGQAETTSPLVEYFSHEHPRLKVYRRQGDRVLIPPARINEGTPAPPLRLLPGRRSPSGSDLTLSTREAARHLTLNEKAEALLFRLPLGIVVIDRRYDIVTINSFARLCFGIHGTAIGEDFIHLAQGIDTGRLRGAIDAVLRGQNDVRLSELQTTESGSGEPRYLDIVCVRARLDGESGPIESVLITAADVTAAVAQRRGLEEDGARLREEMARITQQMERLADTNRQLLEANQELTTTNAELRSANEEFLISNEEAQAATEEVETLNEELQATNEELETLNEELQATVEELNTTNDDLQARSVELQDLAVSLEAQRRTSDGERSHLEAIFVSLPDPTLIVDRAGRRVLSNASYDHLMGGGEPTFRDADGKTLRPEDSPQRRAGRGERFRVKLTIPSEGPLRQVDVVGAPIQGPDDGGGIVALREVDP